jgi:hypothetical protein
VFSLVLREPVVSFQRESGRAAIPEGGARRKRTSFEESRRVFSPMKYKWLQGVKGLPFEFMNVGEVWIYHPKLDALINVSHVTALASELRRVADGTVSWKSRADFTPEDL